MFAIYKQFDIAQTHEFLRPVDGLGGQAGPIAKHIRSIPMPEVTSDQILRWHLSESDLLADYLTDKEKEQEGRYKLIIDLKPRAEDELLFFQILDIWGCSDPAWTPVMLRLCFVFEADTLEQVQEVRSTWKFVPSTDCRRTNDFVYEFLYLKFGWKGGNWGWGTLGSVNGALLFPRHLQFFLQQIEKYKTGE